MSVILQYLMEKVQENNVEFGLGYVQYIAGGVGLPK